MEGFCVISHIATLYDGFFFIVQRRASHSSILLSDVLDR